MVAQRLGRRPVPAEDGNGDPMAWDVAAQPIGYNSDGKLKEPPYAWIIHHPTGQYVEGGSNPTNYLGADPRRAQEELFAKMGWTHPVTDLTSPNDPLSASIVERFEADPERLQVDPLAPIAMMKERLAVLSKLRDAARGPDDFGPIGKHDVGMVLAQRIRDYKAEYGEDAEPDPLILLMDQPTLVEWYKRTLLTHLEHHADWLADLTGYDQFRAFRHLTPPKPDMKLSDLAGLYEQHKRSVGRLTKTAERQIGYWKEFVTVVGVSRVDQLTPKHWNKYNTEIYRCHRQRGQSDGNIRNRFIGVKAIVNNAWKRGTKTDALRRAVDSLDALERPIVPAGIPQPISVDHYRAILEACKSPLMRSIILMALNCCLKPEDFPHLEKLHLHLDDPKGPHYWAIRHKTRDKEIPQASMLWVRTVEQIKAYRRSSKRSHPIYEFIGQRGKPISAHAIRLRWDRLRTKAGVPEAVKFEHIVDGAITLLDNDDRIPDRHINLLKGHSAGMRRRYSLPDCRRTAKAVAIVEQHYLDQDQVDPRSKATT